MPRPENGRIYGPVRRARLVLSVSALLWHPWLDADLAHRWLLGYVREVCAEHLVLSHKPA